MKASEATYERNTRSIPLVISEQTPSRRLARIATSLWNNIRQRTSTQMRRDSQLYGPCTYNVKKPDSQAHVLPICGFR